MVSYPLHDHTDSPRTVVINGSRKLLCQFALLASFAMSASLVAPAYAQETEGLFSLSLQELSQIKVTIANRHEESFIDAPSSVTVITRREIDQLGVRTLNELLNYVPGFQSYMSPHDSNRSMILVRGLADIYGRNVLLMIDGRRINDEYTGGFTFADHLLSLYNAKQVEFIRGPGSAMYGSNAFSGAINIITEKRKEAVVTIGTNQAKGVTAATYGRAGELEISAAFDYYRDNGQSYNGLTDKNGFNKSTQDPVEVFQGRTDLSYQRSRLILEYMNTRLADYYVFRRINNGDNKNDSERLGVYLEQDFKLQGWQGSGRIGFMRHNRNQRSRLSPADTTLFTDDWRQDTREAQVDLSKLTQGGHQLSLGAYVAAMDIPRASDSFTDRFVLDESRRTLGLYIQDQFDLLTRLRLTAGLRYDNYSDFGETFNPRLALRYRLRENNSVKFMYGRAYRAPSLGDLYDKESIISGGNLFLEPVIVNSYELAYLYSKTNNSLILTWFYNDYQNFITTRTLADGQTIFDNAYDNQTQGLELDWRWQFGTHWNTRLGYTHILSSNTTAPEDVDFSMPDELAPTNYGNLQLNYLRQKWNWNISTVAYDGITVLQDSGAVIVVNSKLAYRITRHWELGANIRNLLDKNYSTPQNQALGQDQAGRDVQEMPSRGREFFLTLRFSENS